MQADESTANESDHTFAGLCHWYKHMIEKFGWILIARKQNNNDKLACYRSSLDSLNRHLSLGLKMYQDPDRRTDLEIMLANVNYLQRWGTTCFATKES